MPPNFINHRPPEKSVSDEIQLSHHSYRVRDLFAKIGTQNLRSLTDKQKALIFQEILPTDFEGALSFAVSLKLPSSTIIRGLSCERFKAANPQTFANVSGILHNSADRLGMRNRALVNRLAKGHDISVKDRPTLGVRSFLATCRDQAKRYLRFQDFVAPEAKSLSPALREATRLVGQLDQLHKGLFYGRDVLQGLERAGVNLDQKDRKLVTDGGNIPRSLFNRITDDPKYNVPEHVKRELEQSCRVRRDPVVFQIQRQEAIRKLEEESGIRQSEGSYPKAVFNYASFSERTALLVDRGALDRLSTPIKFSKSQLLLHVNEPGRESIIHVHPAGSTIAFSAERIYRPVQGSNFIAYPFKDSATGQLAVAVAVVDKSIQSPSAIRFHTIRMADKVDKPWENGPGWFSLLGKENDNAAEIVAISPDQRPSKASHVEVTRAAISLPTGLDSPFLSAVDNPTAPRLAAFKGYEVEKRTLLVTRDNQEHLRLQLTEDCDFCQNDGLGLVVLSVGQGQYTLRIVRDTGEIKQFSVPEGYLVAEIDRNLYFRPKNGPRGLYKVSENGVATTPTVADFPDGRIQSLVELEGATYFIHSRTGGGRTALYSSSGERISPYFEHMSIGYDDVGSPFIIAQDNGQIFSFTPSIAEYPGTVEAGWKKFLAGESSTAELSQEVATSNNSAREMAFLLLAALKEPTAENVAAVSAIITDSRRGVNDSAQSSIGRLRSTAHEEAVRGLDATNDQNISQRVVDALGYLIRTNTELFPHRPGLMPKSYAATVALLEDALPELRGEKSNEPTLADLFRNFMGTPLLRETPPSAFDSMETTTNKGGDREALRDKTLLVSLDREHRGFLAGGIYFGYDSTSAHFIKASPKNLVKVTDGVNISATILGRSPTGMQQLPTPVHVEAESVTVIQQNGRETRAEIELSKDGMSYVQADHRAQEIDYSFKVTHQQPPLLNTQAAYRAMVDADYILQEASKPKVTLPPRLQTFADSIRGHTPIEQINAIRTFVSDVMHYDLDNQVVSASKAGSPLQERLLIMEKRLTEIRSTESVPNSKLLAGVCADAAEVSMLLCNELGLAAGIAHGFQVSGQEIYAANSHAICMVAMPTTDGKVALVELDGTPENVSPEARELLSFALGSSITPGQRKHHLSTSSHTTHRIDTSSAPPTSETEFLSTIIHVAQRDLDYLGQVTDLLLYGVDPDAYADIRAAVEWCVSADRKHGPTTNSKPVDSSRLWSFLDDLSAKLTDRNIQPATAIESLARCSQSQLTTAAKQVLLDYTDSLPSDILA